MSFRLFAFPHAGGGHRSFGDWAGRYPADVEVLSYSLPGRGREQDKPPYQRWEPLVRDLADLVSKHDDGAPFAFFGHSFGALVAFDVCRQLADDGRRMPELLLLSAHRAPHRAPAQAKSLLAPDTFIDAVREWGLVPDDLLADPQLLDLVIPPLRADVMLDESYICRTGERSGRRLKLPCVVYGGAEDKTVTEADLRAWREHFDAGTDFGVEILPGGHFFTISSQAALLSSVTGHLGRARAWLGPSAAVSPATYQAPDRGVWERFQEQVAAGPGNLALADQARRWTYRELSDEARALASALAARGIGKGDVVGLLLPHSAEYCIGMLTCFGIGAPACLLDRNWPASLLAQFLESAGAAVVVTTREHAGLLPPAFQAPGRLLVLGEDQDQDGAASPAEFPRLEPAGIALISMTSGTSGTPKAVLNTYQGCLYSFDARYRLYPYEQSSRDGLNVFFAWECLRPLLQGKPAIVIPDDHIVDPVRLVGTLEEFMITRLVVTPSLLEILLYHPAMGPALASRLGHLEIVYLMGEVVPARVVSKAAMLLPARVRLVNSYSTWESLDASFADLLPRPAGGAAGNSPFAPVGKILDGSAAVLLDDDGKVVHYGGVGELYFSSPGLATGYLGDPGKTAERFVPCPPDLAGTPFAGRVFYRTGDRARFLPGGDLEILGRTGDVVKLRGFKVSLRAVQNVLSDQDGVAQVVVRPILDSRTRQPGSLIAYLVGDQGKPSETVLARARQKARRDLPEYARPRHFVGLDALPISRGGSRKLDLSALPAPPDEAPGAAGTSGTGGHGEPLTTTEQRVASAWREVLGVVAVEPDDNFFDIGGDSLSAARLSGLLAERFGISLPVIEVFQFATLREMAGHCAGGEAAGGPAPARPRRAGRPGEPGPAKLAVVGMAGRFPGAPDLDAFWDNLTSGTDSLTVFPAGRLRRKGVAEDVISHPDWVPAGQLLDDADKFDAEFWGIGRREAVLMDPQHRVFIEVAWEALEQAGYARKNNPYRRRTSVFAACGIDGYLIHHLKGGGLTEPLDPAGVFLTEIGNEKDYIATRVSYLLDLGGPAVTVTSACSSGLVAVAQAAASIMSGQCDMAIAGASSINFPNFGYRYEDGLVGSVDGHVRPFDAAASGTLFGDSVGAVVLKRLDDAIADGDFVWAVLTGFGVSNDGRMKAGYTAPSALAQSQCIGDAIAMAGIGSEQISYVECHATATHVGDAIEIKGLSDAFSRHRGGGAAAPAHCAVGSVKGNIGHANCAAGITGFIKTVLCLHHRTLVPTVNYRTLNPKLVGLVDSAGSPFTVQETGGEWTVADAGTQLPRRAGVSSFGIGGTNAHVILEEAARPGPARPAAGDPRSLHLVTVSARSQGAFRRNAQALARFFGDLPADEVARSVRALHLSRESHALRSCAVIERGPEEIAGDLRRLAGQPPRAAVRQGHAGTVAFCFSGQGSQTAGMARGLYRGRADGGRFRRHFDAATGSLARHLPADPAALILGADERSVMRPVTTQCGLFAVEYAIARTLIDIGITPLAVAGHSIGEYAAATVADVLTLDEAAALVAVRALATEELRPAGPPEDGAHGAGGMLSVVGDEDSLNRWLEDHPELWLAAENAPGRLVISGAMDALHRAAAELPALGFTCRPVPVSHPFHSGLMAPVAARLGAAASGLEARAPAVPMASNLTGTWLDSRYRPGAYWSEHVISKVRWREDVAALLKWEPDLILEIGPGTVLTALARKCIEHAGGVPGPLLLATVPDAKDPAEDDEAGFLRAIGELWCRGAAVDFAALHEGEPAAGGQPVVRRLPPYSFDRTSYWTRPQASVYVDEEPASGRPAGLAGGSGSGSPDDAAWPLVRFASRPGAALRLYCFPYAGGSSRVFQAWAHAAPAWLDVVAVELPGRGGQAGQAIQAADRDDEFLARLAEAIRSDAAGDQAAFCGLSFGASLVLDLLSGPLAGWAHGGRVSAVCVAGRAPVTPGAPEADLPAPPPDAYLMIPDELREDPRWKQEVLPLLKADLAFDARSQQRVLRRQEAAGPSVLSCPLQVHCGTEDPSFPSASARDWAAVTASPIVEVSYHEGSHDFLLYQGDSILAGFAAFADRLSPRDRAGRAGALYEVGWVPVAAPGSQRTSGDIPWTDLSRSGPAESARFLVRQLTGPSAVAALLCPLPADLTPGQHCERLVELLHPVLRAEARGRLILVLPARDVSGLVTGLTRSLAHEEPGLLVQRVYAHPWPADGRGGGPQWTGRLLGCALAHAGEADLLSRDGHLLAQRLLPACVPGLPEGTLGACAGRYLVTGGTGGIGRVVTDWLIQDQAVAPQDIVVSGRTARDDLRRGVRFAEIDFARPASAGALAAELGPLAGIFHLAGALDDGVLRNLDGSRFPAVLAPKLALPWLAELGRAAAAPWIAVFSSTSALLGAPGQANYAAANAWADAHAMWSAPGAGPVIVSVNWGTWGEAGMAARDARAIGASLAGGETPLRSGDALRLLGQLVASLLPGGSGRRNLAACDVDWQRAPLACAPLASLIPAGSGDRPASPARDASPPPAMAHQAAEQEGEDGIRSFLRAYVHQWDDSERLVDLGLDSLDFARIKSDFARKFGKDVPLAVIASPGRRLGELYSLLAER